MRVHLVRLFVVLSVITLPSSVRANPDLMAAIRNGDARAARRLLATGADPDARDESGASVLMHAALYASPECLQVLLDRGADINAPNQFGSTALMWAAGDAAKVRLLLERGASVNATAKDGTTALIVAARHRNAEAVRLLLARGASPRPSVEGARELVRVAYAPENEVVRDLLARAGLGWSEAAKTGGPVLSRNPDPSAVRHLLDAGGNANERNPNFVTMSLPVLGLAAHSGETSTVRLLLARGANPNDRNERGLTPLMLAATGDGDNSAVVRSLIDGGADVTVRDENGRTALDWAMLSGETPAAAMLRRAGSPESRKFDPTPSSVSTPRNAFDAIRLALKRVQPAGPVFYQRTKCYSCHNQGLPSAAVAVASARGVPIDRLVAAHTRDVTLAQWRARRERYLLASPPIGLGDLDYALFGLAEERVPPGPVTDAVILSLASLQADNGSWNGGPGSGIRRPINGGPATTTAMAIRALEVFTPPGLLHQTRERIARARQFLLTYSAEDTQDEAFKLLGLVWSGASRSDVTKQRRRLLALQRADGGWAQLSTLASDAYATGQALYALHASGMSVHDSAYQQGVRYLLRTQLDDGTWHVRSRAMAFQPYFETGFPHGRDQFISTAATSWAVIGLAYTLGE